MVSCPPLLETIDSSIYSEIPGGWGYSVFQVTGMFEGFFGVLKFSIPRIFGQENFASIF